MHTAHQARLPDGTPILRSCVGKRVRYAVQPLEAGAACDDDLSQASTIAMVVTERTSLDGVELVKPPPRACICSSCNQLVVDPVAGPCGHAYCRTCAPPPSCLYPGCGKKLEPQGMRSSQMTSWLLDSLEARCTSEDCAFVGTPKAVIAHAAECAHVVVSCPHQVPAAPPPAQRKGRSPGVRSPGCPVSNPPPTITDRSAARGPHHRRWVAPRALLVVPSPPTAQPVRLSSSARL